MQIEDSQTTRYWSFSFWLKKSIWLGLTAMAAWMVWQFIFRDYEVISDNVFFTNTALRIIGGLLFAGLTIFFGARFRHDWRKDAMVESVFLPNVDTAEVIGSKFSDELPEVESTNRTLESQAIDTPPPFASQDDLTSIDGIGPSIQDVLRSSNISTYSDLARQTTEQLETVLTSAGESFRFHDPTDWPRQAQQLVDAQWQELEKS